MAGQRGVAVIVALFTLLLVSLIGSALVQRASTELLIADNFRSDQLAFYAAEAGLEQILFELQADTSWQATVAGSSGRVVSPFPTTLTVGERTIRLSTDGEGAVVPGWYDLGPEVVLEAGETAFSMQLFLPPDDGEDGRVELPMRAVGRTLSAAEEATVTVRSMGRFDIGGGDSIWDNILFSDFGKTGGRINGHVDIHGSIHVLGDPDADSTIDLGGTAGLHNSYAGLKASVANKLPELDQVDVNGEMVETLHTEVRLRDAQIELSGTGDIGEPDRARNRYKETVDAIFADTSAIDPADRVHTDSWQDYDSDFEFPYLDESYTDPDTGTEWASHNDYVAATAMSIPVREIGNATASFSYSDGNGNSISWDTRTNELTVEGVISISGDLTLGSMQYRGTGTLVASGDINLDGSVVPVADYLGDDPDDGNLGLVAGDEVRQTTNKAIDVIAAIYAANAFYLDKKSVVAGAIVAGTFDLGRNVPTVAQVPLVADMLPPALPGGADRVIASGDVEVTGWYRER